MEQFVLIALLEMCNLLTPYPSYNNISIICTQNQPYCKLSEPHSLEECKQMRLAINDMSYEVSKFLYDFTVLAVFFSSNLVKEGLLTLGERIGSVATGVPNHLISKCVQESIYCS